MAELSLERWLARRGPYRCALRPLDRFPAVARDLSLLCDERVPAADLVAAIRGSRARPLARCGDPRPLRRGERVPPGQDEPDHRSALPGSGPYTDRRGSAGGGRQGGRAPRRKPGPRFGESRGVPWRTPSICSKSACAAPRRRSGASRRENADLKKQLGRAQERPPAGGEGARRGAEKARAGRARGRAARRRPQSRGRDPAPRARGAARTLARLVEVLDGLD